MALEPQLIIPLEESSTKNESEEGGEEAFVASSAALTSFEYQPHQQNLLYGGDETNFVVDTLITEDVRDDGDVSNKNNSHLKNHVHLATSTPQHHVNNKKANRAGTNEDKKEKVTENSINSTSVYHPEFMFCGECTSCGQPPPPLALSNIPKKKKVRPMVFVPGRQKKYHSSILCLSNWKTLSPSNDILQSLLQSMEGIGNINCDDMPNLRIHHDALICNVSKIKSTLTDLGYEVTVQKDAAFALLNNDQINNHHDDNESKNKATYSKAGEDMNDDHDDKYAICRSQLYVEGICCLTEVPIVTDILYKTSRAGVEDVKINITSRIVYIDHDPYQVSIQTLAEQLKEEGFAAHIKKDGGSKKAIQQVVSQNMGQTTLALQQKIDRKKDVPIIQNKLKRLKGVTRIGINIDSSLVYVIHSTIVCTAKDCQNTLMNTTTTTTTTNNNNIKNNKTYVCEIQEDAAPVANHQTSSIPKVPHGKFVESTLLAPSMTTLGQLHIIDRLFTSHFVKSQVRAHFPHVPSHTIKIEHNPKRMSAQSVVNLLNTNGFYNVTVNVDGAIEGLALPSVESYDSQLEKHSNTYDNQQQTQCYGLNTNVILSGIFWLISMLSFVGGNWTSLKYAGLFSVICGIPPVTAKALRTIRRRQFDANCMMVIAAFGALALQEYDEAASVAFLFSLSEWLEDRASFKARRALNAIVNLRPENANAIDPLTGGITIIPAEKLPVGHLVSVRTGDKIPADGVVVEGSSVIDESSMTGEAKPVSKKVGESVSGGSINVGSTRLVVKTTSSIEDSAVSRLIQLVEEAQSNRSTTEKLVDSFAKRYTPVIIIMATLMCTFPWAWGKDSGRYWTLNGLIIIVVSCPCALTISTPVTYAAGLAATAQRGIIIKGGAKLEALGSVKKVIFDKTGTLTEGKFRLIHLDVVGNKRTRKEIMELLALIEAHSSHPLSATLVDAAKREGVDISRANGVKRHSILKGEGVTAQIGSENVYVGNMRLFQRLGMYEDLEEVHKCNVQKWNLDGATTGFLAIENVGIVCIFSVSDVIREEAYEVIPSLQENDIDVILLTGDGDGAAKLVADELGIPHDCVHSQLLPEDKLHFVGSMLGVRVEKEKTNFTFCGSEKEIVLMCGDGVNDAPALAVADIGVAMGDGASLAMEMSDVTLMDSNLVKLLYSIRMGKRVVFTIKENIMFSVGCKLTVVVLTFFGKMTLLFAIATDVGVMLAVTLNGMKLLSREKNYDWLHRLFKPKKFKKLSGEDYSLEHREQHVPNIV